MFASPILTHSSFESRYSTEPSLTILSVNNPIHLFYDPDSDETMRKPSPLEKEPSREEGVASIKQQILALAQSTSQRISWTHSWAAQPSVQGTFLQVRALENASNTLARMQSVLAKIERLDIHFALRPEVPAEGNLKDDIGLLATATLIDAVGSLQFHELALALACNISAARVQKWLNSKKPTSALWLSYQEDVAPYVKATLDRKRNSIKVIETVKSLFIVERPYLPESLQSQLIHILSNRNRVHLALDNILLEEQKRCQSHLGIES